MQLSNCGWNPRQLRLYTPRGGYTGNSKGLGSARPVSIRIVVIAFVVLLTFVCLFALRLAQTVVMRVLFAASVFCLRARHWHYQLIRWISQIENVVEFVHQQLQTTSLRWWWRGQRGCCCPRWCLWLSHLLATRMEYGWAIRLSPNTRVSNNCTRNIRPRANFHRQFD